ncbi:MAG: hypothetical protein KUG75_13060 [Pseudomonadales bacterium]|nr:hypothetical protein [Pseudomonadales bacterium]
MIQTQSITLTNNRNTPATGFLYLVLWGLASFADLSASEMLFDSRLKIFGSSSFLPADDLQRSLDGSPVLDINVDARFMLTHQTGNWAINLESAINYSAGDSLIFSASPQSTLNQVPVDDDARLINLTVKLSAGERHRLINRFDRASIIYREENWSVSIGRQALSWGSGLIFQPLDLFSPFSPTTVDRDYKAGDDMLNIEYLFKNGSDVQWVSVLRRDPQRGFAWSESSSGLKWHGFVGELEIEVLAGKHFRDDIAGFSLAFPLGGAMLRSNLLLTFPEVGSVLVSGVINTDYSFAWKDRTIYIFGEYFHNGFGSKDKPVDITNISFGLRRRLARGELFNLQRDYVALGIQIQWHPLLGQAFTLMSNLQDMSSLGQLSFSYEPGDHQRFQFGAIKTLGKVGEEFGRINVLPGLTTGGGTRVYLRYMYFF